MRQNYSLPVTRSRSSNASNNNAPKITKRKSPLKNQRDVKKKKRINTPEEENNNSNMIGQSSKILCGICFDSITDSQMFKITCNHPFCVDCISKHVTAQISNNNVLKMNCPTPNCCVELNPQNLQPILPNEVIVRWEAARCESSIATWQKSYCPFKDCSVLLVNDGGNVVTSSECPSCHRLFCAQCKVPWHLGRSCREFQMVKSGEDGENMDRMFFELAGKERWQKCPRCFVHVLKTSGCEHITCRCGWNFCYICGKDWAPGHKCN